MQRKRTNRNKDTAQERLQSPHATHQYCTFQMLIPAGPMLCCSPRPLLPFPILIHNPLLAGQQGRMAGGQQGLREKESALPPPNPSSPHRWGHPFRAIGSIVCPIKTILRSPMLLAQGTSSLGFTTPPSNLQPPPPPPPPPIFPTYLFRENGGQNRGWNWAESHASRVIHSWWVLYREGEGHHRQQGQQNHQQP